MERAIALMEWLFRDWAEGRVTQPVRTVMGLPERGAFAVMPAWLAERGVVGAKMLSIMPGNGPRRLPSHQGVIALMSAADGHLLGIVDAQSVTAIRTAAVSAVATHRLARADAKVLTLIGTGEQARTHADAMLAVRPFTRIWLVGRNPERADACRADILRHHNVEVVVTRDAAHAVGDADVICTLTDSPTPVLLGSWVTPGTHVNAVGACRPAERECDSTLVARARLFVDSRDAARVEAGDYLIPLAEGAITEEHLLGELGDLVTDHITERTTPTDITLFKALGLAAEDIEAARWVLEGADPPS
jgi:ornithine cyclodeaminase